MTSTRDVDIPDDVVTRVIPAGRRLGLVIGIDAYEDPGIAKLSAAVADANLIHKAMVDPECGRFDAQYTTVLTNASATESGMKIQLERLRKIATLDDEVWFFYAGHAMIVDGEHRLLPVNSQKEFLDATSVNFSELFQKIRCRRKIVFLDCCHAGATSASTRDVHNIEDVLKSYDATGTITYCSSDGDQKSVELPERGQGAFTYWLERGLRGEADSDNSGVVSSDELWKYVCDNVERDAKRETGQTQTPRLKSDTSGAFALSVNAGAVRKWQEDQAVNAARDLAAQASLTNDRQDLRKLLGESDLYNLSTDELKAAIRLLEGEPSRGAALIRKALTAFRSDSIVEDAAMTIKGIVATVSPPPVSPPAAPPMPAAPVVAAPVAAAPVAAAPVVATPVAVARRDSYLKALAEKLTQLGFTKYKPARFGQMRYTAAFETAVKGSMGVTTYQYVVAIEEQALTVERVASISAGFRTHVKFMAGESNDFHFALCVLLADSIDEATKDAVRAVPIEKSGWFSNPSSSVVVIYDASDDFITFPDNLPADVDARYFEMITKVLTPMAS